MSKQSVASDKPIPPTTGYFLSRVFLVLAILFNIWLVPLELGTNGMFGAGRDPQDGLFILCLINIASAVAALFSMKKLSFGFVTGLLALLVFSSMYAYWGAMASI
jgi:hypothetical protein